MKIVPIQFFGAGDVIFEQTLVRLLADGNPIMWPVEPHFVEGFSRAYHDILFVDRTKFKIDYNRQEDYTVDNVRYLPLRWADIMLKLPYTECMKSKYTLYGMDWEIWKEKAMWERDEAAEDRLFQALGLKEGEEYTLINRFFGTQSQLTAQIHQKGVEMCTIAPYSLFDWAKVICNASHIHTVSTSIIYLLELLDLKAKEVHLYPRIPHERDFKNVEYILQKHTYKAHLDGA